MEHAQAHVPLVELERPSEPPSLNEGKDVDEDAYKLNDIENPSALYIRKDYLEIMDMMDKAAAFAPPESAEDLPSQFTQANWLSRIFFCWMYPLVKSLRSGGQQTENLILGTKERTSNSSALFLSNWKKEKQKSSPSLIKALWASYSAKFLRALWLKLLWGICMVVMNSYLIYLFVEGQFKYKNKLRYGEDLQYVLAFLFFIIPFGIGFMMHHMESMCVRLGVRLRTSLVSAIYGKALKAQITSVALSPIISLVTKDCAIIAQAPVALLRVFTGLFEVLLLLLALIPFIRWFGIIYVFGLCFVVVPVQYYFGLKITSVRARNTSYNSERVHIVYEVLYAIKLVKFYVWEESFAEKIKRIRNSELSLLKIAAFLKTANLAVIISLPPACAVGVFFLYVIQSLKLTPMQSFTLLNVANSLRFPLFALPSSLKIVNEMFSSLEKIQTFLLDEEFAPIPEADELGIEFKNCTFQHRELKVPRVLLGTEKQDKSNEVESSPKKFQISELSLAVKPGEILAIIGSFGSGKTTILRSLLGETEVVSGSVKVKGSIAYVPQTPWIMHGTVRDNILFGKPFDRAWYMRVVRACCLLTDLKMLEEHDMTTLSEGGVNLSGGQRQRIALARAVYSRADIYILDSVLSALDPITGRTIFRRVNRGLLKNATIILVTHNLEVIPQCHRILALDEGNVKYIGPYDVEMVHKIFPDTQEENSKHGSSPVVDSGIAKNTKEDDRILKRILRAKEMADMNMSIKEEEKPAEIAEIAKEIRDEQVAEDNHLKTDLSITQVAHTWAKNAGLCGTLFTVFLFPAAQGVRIFMDFWVRFWQSDTFNLGPGSDLVYVGYYALIFLVFIIFLFWRGLGWYFYSFNASNRLHNNFFKAIVHAPMLFFTKEPLGRILKSYSKDQDQVDDSLPDVTHMALIYFSISLATLITLIILLPVFAILAVALIIAWILLQKWTAFPVTACKNAVARTDAQVIVHISESLHGIAVVRAFAMQENMQKENEICLDAFGSSVFHLEHMSLWTAAIFDVIAALFVFISALICIGSKDQLDAPQVGVIITNATQLLIFLGLMVNALNDSAYQMFSVGRLQYYIDNTPSEDFNKQVDLPIDNRKRPYFPTGQITFDKVDMKYDPMRDRVLKELSFDIKDGERIGIVGRTGSGKSTTINAIFRLTEICGGSVFISNLKIQDLYIKDLRRSISIIPQEPIVFRGTIRSNLDPFNECSDDELREALRASNMLDVVNELPQGIDAEVTEGGGNLSVGQRQLLCLTRVCLRKDRRILILDEATSALDPVTDQAVQKALREVFNRHTVLTIAHRLDTIIDYDKIMVLNAGTLMEFDSVPNLLKKPDGLFRQMYEGSH